MSYPLHLRVGPRLYIITKKLIIEDGITIQLDYTMSMMSDVMGEYNMDPEYVTENLMEAFVAYAKLRQKYDCIESYIN